MSYLRVVLSPSELQQAPEPAPSLVATGSPGMADAAQVDGDSTTATITSALQAWGLRVRAEREHRHAGTKGLESDASWKTTRPESPRASRLLNTLSPVWLPGLEQDAPSDEADLVLSWFQRVA